MKKNIAILLLLVTVFCLFSCENKTEVIECDYAFIHFEHNLGDLGKLDVGEYDITMVDERVNYDGKYKTNAKLIITERIYEYEYPKRALPESLPLIEKYARRITEKSYQTYMSGNINDSEGKHKIIINGNYSDVD